MTYITNKMQDYYVSVIYECLECKTIVHMNYIIEGEGGLAKEAGEEILFISAVADG